METVSRITVQKKEFEGNRSSLIGKLKEQGVLVCRAFISPGQIEKLNAEFDEFLEKTQPYIQHVEYSNGKAVRVKTADLEKERYPETLQVYTSKLMQDITNEYFGKTVKSNTGVYLVNDVVGTRHHANDLHFDVQRSLKFFIYLTDTSAKNGAFYCVPGSHKFTGQIRKKYGADISYENRELSRDLPVKDEDAVPLEGEAGTLIIFDTDVFHKAGTVSEGERRVMRGYSDFVITTQPKRSILGKVLNRIGLKK